jgi:hypothetical protein
MVTLTLIAFLAAASNQIQTDGAAQTMPAPAAELQRVLAPPIVMPGLRSDGQTVNVVVQTNCSALPPSFRPSVSIGSGLDIRTIPACRPARNIDPDRACTRISGAPARFLWQREIGEAGMYCAMGDTAKRVSPAQICGSSTKPQLALVQDRGWYCW